MCIYYPAWAYIFTGVNHSSNINLYVSPPPVPCTTKGFRFFFMFLRNSEPKQPKLRKQNYRRKRFPSDQYLLICKVRLCDRFETLWQTPSNKTTGVTHSVINGFIRKDLPKTIWPCVSKVQASYCSFIYSMCSYLSIHVFFISQSSSCFISTSVY